MFIDVQGYIKYEYVQYHGHKAHLVQFLPLPAAVGMGMWMCSVTLNTDTGCRSSHLQVLVFLVQI